MKPYLIDTTLRDGEQTPGILFDFSTKKRLLDQLDAFAIDEVEIGSACATAMELDEIKQLIKHGYSFYTSIWSRALKSDIDNAKQLGCDAINISFPVSDIQLFAMRRDRKWVFDVLPKIVRYARKFFKSVNIGLQDATRADFGFISKVIMLAKRCEVNRVRIADTVGVFSPIDVMAFFNKLNCFEMDYEFHAHNDLGMATANSLVALKSGAHSISCTIGGIGERAGNCSIEEIVAALKYSQNIEINYNLSIISKMFKLLKKITKFDFNNLKPIVGNNVFTHESGIHTNLISKNRATYQIIDNSLFGRDHDLKFILGKHSGISSVKQFLKEIKVDLSEDEMSQLLDYIKNYSYYTTSYLTKEELKFVIESKEFLNEMEFVL